MQISAYTNNFYDNFISFGFYCINGTQFDTQIARCIVALGKTVFITTMITWHCDCTCINVLQFHKL